MRVLLICLVLGVLWSPLYAAALKTEVEEEQKLVSLEIRAEQSPLRSQCLAYAQLVHEMVEYSAHQYAAGNTEGASGMLRRSQELTRKIREHLTGDTKKVK